MGWRKTIGITLAVGAVLFIGCVVVFVFALVGSTDKHINVFSKQYYRSLIQDKVPLHLPESAQIIAIEDSVRGYGMENELTARCLIQVGKADFDTLLSVIKKDSAFKASESGALMRAVTDKQPVKVINAANKIGLLREDFTNVYSRNRLGSYWITLGFHKSRKYIFVNYNRY